MDFGTLTEGEYFGEVFLGIDAQAAAVLHYGVEDGALLSGLLVVEEQPVFGSELGRADRVLDEIVADFHPAVAKIGFELGPLVDGVADGFAEFALTWNPHAVAISVVNCPNGFNLFSCVFL